MKRFAQSSFILTASAVLLSCASPKMSQELEGGKYAFQQGEYKTAFHQLLPVAGNGHRPEAEYAVGYMYYYGLGVTADQESGIFWMEKSAEQNYQPAEQALELIHHPPVPQHAAANRDISFHREAANDEDPLLKTLANNSTTESDENMVALPPLQQSQSVVAPIKTAPVKRVAVQKHVVTMIAPSKRVAKQKHAVTITAPPKRVAERKNAAATSSPPSSRGLSAGSRDRTVADNKRRIPQTSRGTSELSKSSGSAESKESISTMNNAFTLQLFGAYHLSDVKSVQMQLGLEKNSHIWHTKHNGKDWYVLTYGAFPSSHLAYLEKNKMSSQLGDFAPWVRNVDGLERV